MSLIKFYSYFNALNVFIFEICLAGIYEAIADTNSERIKIKNIEYNSNVNSENSYRFFEVSNVYGANIEQILTCLVSGERHDESWAIKSPKFDKYDMNSIAEDIASMFAIEKHKLNYSIKGHTFNKKNYISLVYDMIGQTIK